jgi:hypothetical protein
MIEKKKDNDNAEWEYFSVHQFTDPYGNELPSATCEYCNKAQPIQLFELNGIPASFHSPAYAKVMMKQVKINGRLQWVCLECLKDLDIEKQKYYKI